MTDTPQWWNAHKSHPNTLIPVYIVNLDIAQSSQLEGQHPLSFKRSVNELQEKIEQALHDARFFFQSWSGDGLVALFDGTEGASDQCVQQVMKVCELFQQFKEKRVKQSPQVWRGARFATLCTFLAESLVMRIFLNVHF